jgi:hypothetical protein
MIDAVRARELDQPLNQAAMTRAVGRIEKAA